jgi:hypothetical protein
MAVAAAVDENKPDDADLNTNIEAPADLDVDDWHSRRYFGHYYNPYGYYNPYRYGKHWRGRRSSAAEDIQQPEAEANNPVVDQDANEHRRRGYYGYYNPYGYRNYGYGKYWRGYPWHSNLYECWVLYVWLSIL